MTLGTWQNVSQLLNCDVCHGILDTQANKPECINGDAVECAVGKVKRIHAKENIIFSRATLCICWVKPFRDRVEGVSP